MRVLLLGGTGSIGAPILRELVQWGHEVTALARSNSSASKLAAAGARPLAGDLCAPERWVSGLPPIDAVVHVAATFQDNEEVIDRRLLEALLPHLSCLKRPVRLVYTGGCWLYGKTDGTVTTEQSPFSPLLGFAVAPTVLSVEQAIAEFGHWAGGYARDQLQSGEKARRRLGWRPAHTDPLNEITALPTDSE